ncbi:MAG: hypothetical protein IJG33_05825 [Selenomonadaceae bacterium]|nr:hypothetical protein [Selenomonadaceae bacterium]
MPNGGVTDSAGVKKIFSDGQCVYDTMSSGENISAPSDFVKRGTLQQHFGGENGLECGRVTEKIGFDKVAV